MGGNGNEEEEGRRNCDMDRLIARFSSVQFSSVQFSSVQFSLVQYSSIQFSPVHTSSVHFSPVQFSSVQFSSVQFSSVQHAEDRNLRMGAPKAIGIYVNLRMGAPRAISTTATILDRGRRCRARAIGTQVTTGHDTGRHARPPDTKRTLEDANLDSQLFMQKIEIYVWERPRP